jgi:predicted methyltransferase
MIIRGALLAGAALMLGGAIQAAPQPSKAIAAAVADPARPAEDVARDAARKPAQIVAFAGVKPGARVAELLPGGGYYTRILARAVGAKGRVYAIVPNSFAQRPGAMDRLKAAIGGYPNVQIVVSDLTALKLPEPVDLVWTSENYHDLHNGPTADPAGVNKAVFAALKRHGTYFVEDHAAPGTGISATSTLHRIDPAAVRSEVQAAGFRLDAESSLLANPADPHTARSNDPTISGRTDKLAMRFRKAIM